MSRKESIWKIRGLLLYNVKYKWILLSHASRQAENTGEISVD
jgi:hypothetical protein